MTYRVIIQRLALQDLDKPTTVSGCQGKLEG
jgi:hypothetical protein